MAREAWPAEDVWMVNVVPDIVVVDAGEGGLSGRTAAIVSSSFLLLCVLRHTKGVSRAWTNSTQSNGTVARE